MTESALDKQIGGDHYERYKIQPIEFLHVNRIPVIESTIIKYVLRHKSKHKEEDLNKAIHCLEILKELEYGRKSL